MTPAGSLRFRDLSRKIQSELGNELLLLCDSEINQDSHDTWLHKVFSADDQVHTLRHLILMRYLKETVQTIFLDKQEYRAFGKGPWPCLNKTAEHYEQEVIQECLISRCSDTKRPIGTFACNCGFVYSRRGPDQSFDDRFKIGRIKQFGEVWELRFNDLQKNSNLSLRQKAEILGVHHSTIKLRSESEKKNKKPASGNNNSKTAQALFKGNSGSNTKIEAKRVDWKERDQKLSILTAKAIEQIRAEIDKPIRVTLPEVGRRVGKLSILEKNLIKCP